MGGGTTWGKKKSAKNVHSIFSESSSRKRCVKETAKKQRGTQQSPAKIKKRLSDLRRGSLEGKEQERHLESVRGCWVRHICASGG